MSKQYGITGLNSIVELGEGGATLSSSGSDLDVLASSLSLNGAAIATEAYADAAGFDPTADQIVTGKYNYNLSTKPSNQFTIANVDDPLSVPSDLNFIVADQGTQRQILAFINETASTQGTSAIFQMASDDGGSGSFTIIGVGDSTSAPTANINFSDDGEGNQSISAVIDGDLRMNLTDTDFKFVNLAGSGLSNDAGDNVTVGSAAAAASLVGATNVSVLANTGTATIVGVGGATINGIASLGLSSLGDITIQGGDTAKISGSIVNHYEVAHFNDTTTTSEQIGVYTDRLSVGDTLANTVVGQVYESGVGTPMILSFGRFGVDGTTGIPLDAETYGISVGTAGFTGTYIFGGDNGVLLDSTGDVEVTSTGTTLVDSSTTTTIDSTGGTIVQSSSDTTVSGINTTISASAIINLNPSSSLQIGGVNGATGSFTAQSGETITVTKGIITAIT